MTAARRPASADPGRAQTESAVRLHAFYRGKIQVAPRCPIRDPRDFAVWYTPGVAEVSRAIQGEPDRVFELTGRGNTVAIVTDGTRVLGLGDVGPESALPVMEGKALLFKHLGAVDAIPICLATKDEAEIVRTVKVLAPAFGAVNLEDIASPKCFRILEALRRELSIPVWHDDQQGSAVVALAGVRGALTVVGKALERARITIVGAGAAGVPTCRLLRAAGADARRIVVCDSRGTLHPDREDVANDRVELAEKWRICVETNADGIRGDVSDALRGADVCVAFSRPGPDTLRPAWIREMAKDAIVLACANPTPEIWPGEAREAGARVVCTGRSDFPNQVNNSLAFPGIFRGVLDVRASAITDEMAIAAADELVRFAAERGLDEDDVVPRMEEWEVFPRVAAAVAAKAVDQGIARVPRARADIEREAARRIEESQRMAWRLVREGLIAPPPD